MLEEFVLSGIFRCVLKEGNRILMADTWILIPSENRQERGRYVYIEIERNRGCGMYRRVLTSFEKWDFSRRKKKEIERKLARLDTFSLCLDMSIG
jgi:hypothetical protein